MYMFFFILLSAHLLAVFVPIVFGIKSINKFKNIRNNFLIPWGFFFFGLASMFEMIDHTRTNWIYINHSSFFNWLFYSSLALGLTSLSISVIKNKFIILINIFLCLCAITSYFLFNKTFVLAFQVMISVSLIVNWQKFFKDLLLIAYPIFGIIFTYIYWAIRNYKCNNFLFNINKV